MAAALLATLAAVVVKVTASEAYSLHRGLGGNRLDTTIAHTRQLCSSCSMFLNR